ncbi:MAG: RNA-directed DNA polymerase [Bacteroidales bacterium]|jgi:RNA-directed DNA polymerase|nr:RNA-directed DNA polymerase [Bacteroidales bacterium]
MKITFKKLKKEADLFCKLSTLNDLAAVISVSKNEILLMAFEPVYYHFTVPKSTGGQRYIEAPDIELKKIQRRLNYFLQKVYYLNQSRAAHGYIISVIGEKNPKTILSQAEKHLGANYMLNVDFSDFFHQISITDVKNIFQCSPFKFNQYAAYTLAKICCYKDRLPMGAPTSPVLSNFYTRSLDEDLIKWSMPQKITYTRFVDDLSFSSLDSPFNITHYEQITEITNNYGLVLNPSKTVYYDIKDEKIVTGLILRETVDILPEFYEELDKDINRLKAINEVVYITGKIQKPLMLSTFKQEVMGKIAFIAQIEGKNSPEYNHYMEKYEDAEAPDEELSVRWTKFGNYLI